MPDKSISSQTEQICLTAILLQNCFLNFSSIEGNWNKFKINKLHVIYVYSSVVGQNIISHNLFINILYYNLSIIMIITNKIILYYNLTVSRVRVATLPDVATSLYRQRSPEIDRPSHPSIRRSFHTHVGLPMCHVPLLKYYPLLNIMIHLLLLLLLIQ